MSVEPDIAPAPPSTVSAARAPMLPVETPIVSAALGASEARNAAERVLYLIRNAPRDEVAVIAAFQAAQAALSASWVFYENYSAIRACEGQA